MSTMASPTSYPNENTAQNPGGSAPAQNVTPTYQGMGPAGGDPFAYTNNSLLTPWTQQFKSTAGTGGAGVSMDPFHYGDLNYQHSGMGAYSSQDYTARPDVQYGQYAPAEQFGYGQGVPQYDPSSGPQLPGEFNYNQGGPTYLSQGPVGGMQPGADWANGQQGTQPGGQGGQPGQPGFTGLGQPNEFQGVDAFQNPNITDDPSFKFRTQEGLDALQNTALGRGVRGGDVQQALLNYGQQAGSQEYAAAWNRAMGKQQNAYNQAQNTYGMNAQTQLQYNQNAYNQAAGAQGLNLQRYGQGQAAQSQNFQNQLAAQGQGYSQAANTFGMNEANRMGAYTANRDTTFGTWDRNTAQAMQVAQMNEQNRLGAYSASSQNDIGQGRLGWDIASGSYDRNRQNALDAWNSQYSMASANAGASNASANQQYSRDLNEYQMAYGIFNQNQENQYNRMMGVANMGMNANGQAIGAGMNYANAYGNNATGAANAYGAGQMAGANAWAQGLGAAGGAAMGLGMAANYGNQNQQNTGYSPYGVAARGAMGP